jgi:hypothetical protein
MLYEKYWKYCNRRIKPSNKGGENQYWLLHAYEPIYKVGTLNVFQFGHKLLMND